jgi:hypothetical protein
VSEEEPRYNDDSIDDDDRLLRAFPHNMYSPPLAEGEQASTLGSAVLTDRLSSQGFQTIPDKNTQVLGMSVYLERLLADDGSPEDLLRFLSGAAKGPLSLMVMLAGKVRMAPPEFRRDPPEGPPLGIMMDPVNEPFGDAHANVIYPEDGGRKFSSSMKNWMRQNAQVLIPELP